MILLGPGSTVSHDALRLLAHARTALAAVGEDGVRLYTAPPLIPDRSGLARHQARLWANEGQRVSTARRMYAWRFGKVPRLSRVRWRTLSATRWERTRRKVKYSLPSRERVRVRQTNIPPREHGAGGKSSVSHILWHYISDSGKPLTENQRLMRPEGRNSVEIAPRPDKHRLAATVPP